MPRLCDQASLALGEGVQGLTRPSVGPTHSVLRILSFKDVTITFTGENSPQTGLPGSPYQAPTVFSAAKRSSWRRCGEFPTAHGFRSRQGDIQCPPRWARPAPSGLVSFAALFSSAWRQARAWLTVCHRSRCPTCRVPKYGGSGNIPQVTNPPCGPRRIALYAELSGKGAPVTVFRLAPTVSHCKSAIS